jgi:hypothetical protein
LVPELVPAFPSESARARSSLQEAVSGFLYRLFSSDGDALGELHTIVTNWRVGETLLTGDGRRFRILAIVPVDDQTSPYRGFFEVDPLEADD